MFRPTADTLYHALPTRDLDNALAHGLLLRDDHPWNGRHLTPRTYFLTDIKDAHHLAERMLTEYGVDEVSIISIDLNSVPRGAMFMPDPSWSALNGRGGSVPYYVEQAISQGAILAQDAVRLTTDDFEAGPLFASQMAL